MGWFYRHFLRPALFTQNAELIHNRTMRGLAWAGRHELARHALASVFAAPELPCDCFGLRFPNPVGLAAGMDKHAEALPAWSALGFGFTELGAVTWHPQPGNPLPRVFRAIPAEAIINRMGFNNPGAEAAAEALAGWRERGLWPHHPVGMNLGKSKTTPLAEAAQDYANSFRVLLPYLDFFVVNVSSPNTPNLRQLQDKAALDEILAALQDEQPTRLDPTTPQPTSSGVASPKPILVKIAPDLSNEAIDEILELALRRKIAGIVATNTTITRPPASDSHVQCVYAETGGLSGSPLRQRSTEVIRYIFQNTNGQLPIIGVGGIFTAADAWGKILAGASLVQVYTGLVFEGPSIARTIVLGLQERLKRAGLRQIRDAVGGEGRTKNKS